ncbi:MAG TPA: hypothetical protein VEB69_00170 [Acidimicrobiia bacterium]|nr:hypothetical protein [Acidimicrobiia bacterium]
MTANTVSRVTGRRQGPILRATTRIAWVLAGLGALSESQPFLTAGVIAVVLVTAAPLLRVTWLILRWTQERDWRFVWTAAALLGVIFVAGFIALVAQ